MITSLYELSIHISCIQAFIIVLGSDCTANSSRLVASCSIRVCAARIKEASQARQNHRENIINGSVNCKKIFIYTIYTIAECDVQESALIVSCGARVASVRFTCRST